MEKGGWKNGRVVARDLLPWELADRLWNFVLSATVAAWRIAFGAIWRKSRLRPVSSNRSGGVE